MTEPDLCRVLSSRRILADEAMHTRPSASDYQVRSRESLSLKNTYMYVTLQVKRHCHLPLVAARLGSGCRLFR